MGQYVGGGLSIDGVAGEELADFPVAEGEEIWDGVDLGDVLII